MDISAKYNVDYTLRVIDKALLSENVKNGSQSKSIQEYIGNSNYEEYNYADAIVDGSIDLDDIMTEEEKKNYQISEKEKEKIIDDMNNLSDAYKLGIEAEKIDDSSNEIVDNTNVENNKSEDETEINVVNNNEGKEDP